MTLWPYCLCDSCYPGCPALVWLSGLFSFMNSWIVPWTWQHMGGGTENLSLDGYFALFYFYLWSCSLNFSSISSQLYSHFLGDRWVGRCRDIPSVSVAFIFSLLLWHVEFLVWCRQNICWPRYVLFPRKAFCFSPSPHCSYPPPSFLNVLFCS